MKPRLTELSKRALKARKEGAGTGVGGGTGWSDPSGCGWLSFLDFVRWRFFGFPFGGVMRFGWRIEVDEHSLVIIDVEIVCGLNMTESVNEQQAKH